jgi:hypothetical protein
MKMCAFANELYRKILLLQVLSGKLPEVLDFVKDLAHLEPASKVSYILMLDPCYAFCLLAYVYNVVEKQIQLKELAEEMQAITKGLEKVEQELATSEKDGPGSETFYKVSASFICTYARI